MTDASDGTPFGGFDHAWALLDGDAQRWLLDHRHEQAPEPIRNQLLRVGLLARTVWVSEEEGPFTLQMWPGFEEFLDKQRDAEQ